MLPHENWSKCVEWIIMISTQQIITLAVRNRNQVVIKMEELFVPCEVGVIYSATSDIPFTFLRIRIHFVQSFSNNHITTSCFRGIQKQTLATLYSYISAVVICATLEYTFNRRDIPKLFKDIHQVNSSVNFSIVFSFCVDRVWFRQVHEKDACNCRQIHLSSDLPKF